MDKFVAEPIIDEHFYLAEAPFYDKRNGMISFVDIVGGRLYVLDAKQLPDITLKQDTATGVCRLENIAYRCADLKQMIGAAVTTQSAGVYLAAGTDGLYLVNMSRLGEAGTAPNDFSLEKILDTGEIFKDYQRSNDAKCDPVGRLFFGSSVYKDDYEPEGKLYCYDGSSVRVMQDNTRISNGMAWSAACDRFFFSDSLYHGVFSYDYDKATGAITNRKLLFAVEDGVPDGMCIDSEDNLYLAVWGGRRVEKRSSKTGELLAVIDVPAEHVTSCCFYGENEDELMITSAGEGLDGRYDGAIFACDVRAKGAETYHFEMTGAKR